jgi:hypothetical protein
MFCIGVNDCLLFILGKQNEITTRTHRLSAQLYIRHDVKIERCVPIVV